MTTETKSTLPTETSPYVERWEQALRVLEGMTEHERTKHFNMGIWGAETDCGTVACLAGHCSLDPWFRDRGFRGKFSIDGYLKFTDATPEGFFGERGNAHIFTGPDETWEDVVESVKAHIDYLKVGGDPNYPQVEDDDLPF